MAFASKFNSENFFQRKVYLIFKQHQLVMLRLQFYLSILIILLTVFSNQSSIAVKNDETCSCKINQEKKEQLKVVNGTVYYANKYPWLTSLQYKRNSGNYTHICGASLINSQWILTAGHCLITNLTRIAIAVGAHNLTGHSPLYEVEKFIRHPDYTDIPVPVNDIALIKVKNPVKLSQTIRPICITSKFILTTRKSLWVAGWGVTEEKAQTTPEKPFELEMNHIDILRCGIVWTGLVNYAAHICAQVTKASPCFGDSGGPLLIHDGSGTMYQVGIVSFGRACTDDQPTVFTRVASYLSWIEKTMESSDYCKVDD